MGTNKLTGKPDEMLGVTCDGLASHPGGVAILLVASCYRNWDELRQYILARLAVSEFFHYMQLSFINLCDQHIPYT